jgi:hypothetical protein
MVVTLRPYWNQKVHRRIHNSLQFVTVFRQMNAAYIDIEIFFFLSFRLIVALESGVVPSGFLTKILTAYFISSVHVTQQPITSSVT